LRDRGSVTPISMLAPQLRAGTLSPLALCERIAGSHPPV